MHRATLRTGLFAALTVASIGCGGGVTVDSDFNPASVEEMQTYETYVWMPPPSDRDTVLTAIDEQRLETAIDSVLASKGFERRVSGTADFKVGFHVTLEGKTDYRTLNNSYGYGWGGWGYGGYGTTVSTTSQQDWVLGTLIIDIVSGRSNELVWRGTAQGEVGKETDPQRRQQRANEAVDKMLAEFPPGGGNS